MNSPTKRKFGSFKRGRKFQPLDFLVAFFTSAGSVFIFLSRSQWNKVNIKEPLFYLADQLTYANLVANAQAGNVFVGSHFGGPGGQQIGSSAYGVEWIQSIFVSFFASFNSGPWLAMNRYFIFTYALTAFFGYLAFRWLELNPLLSFTGAIIFTFAGHHEGDGGYELFQTNLALIPLICALAIHLMNGRNLTNLVDFQNPRLRHSSKLISIGILLGIFLGELTASNYYAIMAVLLFSSLTLFYSCRRITWKKAKSFLFVSLLSLLPLVISYAPVIYMRLNSGLSFNDPSTSDRRPFASYANGGDFFSLFLPNQSSAYWGSSYWTSLSNHLPILKNFFNEYYTSSLINNAEYNQHPVGVIGLGFIILLLALYLGLSAKNKWFTAIEIKQETYRNSLILLTFSVGWYLRGGLGTLFAFLFPYVRAYSRFSIYIVMLTLLALCSIAQIKSLFTGAIKFVIICTLCAGLIDNISSTTPITQSVSESIVHDVGVNEVPWATPNAQGLKLRTLGVLGTRKLVNFSTKAFDPGCTILVLPLLEYPVDFNTGISSFYNYEELKPALEPSTLKWTSAGMQGTKNNLLIDENDFKYRNGNYLDLFLSVRKGPYCGILMMRGLQDAFSAAGSSAHPTYESSNSVTSALVTNFGSPCYSDINAAVDLYCLHRRTVT